MPSLHEIDLIVQGFGLYILSFSIGSGGMNIFLYVVDSIRTSYLAEEETY